MKVSHALDVIQAGKEVLEIEAYAVSRLAERLDETFAGAHELLLGCSGRVVVTGMGKSGHIANKIASTLASTGTPAFFLHPAEASHGDLGMITQHDVVVALSNSGESPEILAIVPFLKRHGIKLVALTGNAQSTLSLVADVHLDASVEKEACPLNLAPTASTTAALALGDALAISLLQARGFSENDFALTHPGGALGKRLLIRVADLMHTGVRLPQVAEHASLQEALLEMTKKGLGVTAIVAADGRLSGIFTDGDLRRTLEKTADLRGVKILDVMSRKPRTIPAERLAVEAAQLMEQHHITCVLVVDSSNGLTGALHTHDLMRAGVI
ncbi:MAG: KpsF/GutQ family sugar-phosphate isomerase [Burkholderiales bacterium]